MCITHLNQFFLFLLAHSVRWGGGALAPFWDESAKRRLQGCLFCSPVISGGGGVSATPEKLLTFDQQLPWGWFLPQFPLGKDAACLCWPTSGRRCRHNLKNVMEISSRGLQGPRNFWECHWGEHQRLPMWMSLLQVPHLFETICCLFCLPQSVSVYHTRCVHGHVHCQLGHDGRTGGPGIKTLFISEKPFLASKYALVELNHSRSFGKGLRFPSQSDWQGSASWQVFNFLSFNILIGGGVGQTCSW